MGRPKKSEPSPDVHGRVTIINLKGSLEQREWIEKLSKKTMIPASRIVRAALNEWAVRNNHSPFPGLDDSE